MTHKTSHSFAAALALTTLAAPAAFAQSTVTIYGTMDAGLTVSKTGAPGVGSIKGVSSGNQVANRLGFRGTEDLGGGLQALFNLESGIDLDTGSPQTLGTGGFWARRSVVGLKGPFGEVTLGRDYTPGFWLVFFSDRHSSGLPGNVLVASQLSDSRTNNGVFYTSPSLGGVTGRLAVAAGEGITGKLYGGSVEYRSGGLYAAVAAMRRDTLATATAPEGSTDQLGLGAQYRFGAYAVNAGFWQGDPVDGATGSVAKTRAYWLGAGATFGEHVIYAQVAKTEFDFVAHASGAGTTYGIAYNYFLSKRTNLYAGYGGVNNDANSRLALLIGTERTGGTTPGADPKALTAGVVHRF